MNRKRALSFVGMLLILTGIIGILGGCGVHKPFTLMDETTRIKKGSIAVICGDSSEPTERLAGYFTQELKLKSHFRVISQEEIGRKVGKYPAVLKRADPENEKNPVWLAKGEKNRLNAMQASLKTDYLFVVWISDLSRYVTTYQRGGSKVTYSATVLGNLYEYPKARPIAYSLFANSKDQSCCLFGKSEGDDINTLLEYSAKEMAKKFLATAQAEKPAK